MKSLFVILLVIWLIQICKPQDYSFIDDIPIESYDHGDHQENEMDLELLPVRHGRSFSLDKDPKEQFFKSLRSFDELTDSKDVDSYQTFLTSHFRERKKRNAPLGLGSSRKGPSLSGLVKSLGKPLEIIPLDSRNLTEKEDKAENRMAFEDNMDLDKDIGINDFIRFRRSANDNSETKARDLTSEPQKMNPLSEKLFMENPSEDSNRETRGTIKEHWTKQVYPVKKSDELTFNDNYPLSSENVRTPRVHFVTQKFADNRLASSDRSDRSYDREPRSRQLDRELPRELPKELKRDIERENPYNERRFRSFSQPRDIRPIFRDDLYSRYDLHNYRGDVYRPRYESYERARNDYSISGQKPQKRIIYYATLPEISRSPPNVDLRDRYRYDRDRYDDRYLSDPYIFRKSFPKSRYEDEGKSPYPVKVLTDVNVREVKKNPERRIYSEVDRTRYAYNTPPYQAADG